MINSPPKFRQVLRMVLILLGLLSVVACSLFDILSSTLENNSPEAEQTHISQTSSTTDLSEVLKVILPATNGVGVPGAAEYNPEGLGPHRFLIINSGELMNAWISQLPEDWIPKTVDEIELVVVLEFRKVALASQAYTNGLTITRYRFELDVIVREVRTGEILLSRTLKGSEPSGFPEMVFDEDKEIIGSRVTFEDFQEQMLDENGLLLNHFRPQCWTTEYFEELNNDTISPDGQFAAGINTYGKKVQVWSIKDGVLINEFHAETDSYVLSVLFSPDGYFLAVGDNDGRVYLWTVPGGELRDTFLNNADRVSELAFSPNGQFLATGDWAKHNIRIWQVRDGALINSFSGPVNSLAFSPDNITLAMGMSDASVELRQFTDGILIDTLSGFRNDVTDMAFSGEGEILLTVCDETNDVLLWNISNGEMVQSISRPSWRINGSAISPDGELLALGGLSEIQLWDVTENALLDVLWNPTEYITFLLFSPDGKSLFSGSNDAVCQWIIQD